MNKIMAWLGQLPTTQTRVVVTLVLVVGTAARYWMGGHMMTAGPTAGQWVQGWAPSIEWLGFLIAMSGLDVTQYTAKRFSDATYVAAKQTGTPPTPTPPGPGT